MCDSVLVMCVTWCFSFGGHNPKLMSAEGLIDYFADSLLKSDS